MGTHRPELAVCGGYSHPCVTHISLKIKRLLTTTTNAGKKIAKQYLKNKI